MDKEDYFLGRGFSANTRLNLQYFLWKDQGYSLHPSIPTDVENLRVAEIGVGTGIWLVDLARCLPKSARIDGFDINLTQCSPKEWLPANVEVHQLDCLKPFPENLLGQYDVVRIQRFHVAVHNNDPRPIIRNFISLLKPGGWIQWAEMDYSRWEVIRTKEGKDVEDSWTPLLEMVGTLGGTKPNWALDDWPIRLPELFEENGLINTAKESRIFPPELLLFQMDTELMASEEASYKAMDPVGNGSGDRCRFLISAAFRDRHRLAHNIGRLTVVGQRPLATKTESKEV
ncbi:S-adenosyl-L-methionine-dependent methyltransferase [Thozetella sp. PMI_491]|nr:S-adenosyl-L-methionine-dependent methyltransferase [Thozetella sp. PMI_491]